MLVHNSRATMRNNIGDLEKETWTRVTDSGSGQPEKFGDIELQQLLNENRMQTQEASCAINLGRQVTSNASNRQSLQYAIERTIRTICIHEGIRDARFFQFHRFYDMIIFFNIFKNRFIAKKKKSMDAFEMRLICNLT